MSGVPSSEARVLSAEGLLARRFAELRGWQIMPSSLLGGFWHNPDARVAFGGSFDDIRGWVGVGIIDDEMHRLGFYLVLLRGFAPGWKARYGEQFFEGATPLEAVLKAANATLQEACRR